MHGCGPRDWRRFERRMGAWGRKFERDMQAMGDDIEREMSAAGRTRCGPGWGLGSVWIVDPDGDARAETDADRPRRPGEPRTDRTEHRAQRAEGHAERGADRWGETRAERAERRADYRAERRAERRPWRRMSRCGPGIWAYWWLAFPLFFLGRNAVEDSGGWSGVGAGAQGLAAWSMNLTLAGPLANLVASVTGLPAEQAFGLLAVSAAACAGAALIGWRTGRPRVGEPES